MVGEPTPAGRAAPFRACVTIIAFLALGLGPLVGAPLGSTAAPDRESARERIVSLRAGIAHHDALYFKQAAPEISDAEYDALKRELRALETAWPDVVAALPSPTQVSDDDRTGLFPTAAHRVPMLSLDKAHTDDELALFLERTARQLGRSADAIAWRIEPKVDGIAVAVTYEHGRFVRAVTRGDGQSGDDITANALTIDSLPRELSPAGSDAPPAPDLLELRGELYMTFAELERINRERVAAGEEPFANPRNLAAGTAKLTDPATVAERRLSIVFYGWGAWEPAETRPASLDAFNEKMKAWSAPTLDNVWTSGNVAGVVEAVHGIERLRRTLPFPIDGAVVKVGEVAQQEQLGLGEHAPRWALACKFAPDRAETRLLAITIQIGRTGVLTPVAEFEPAELAGTTVTRASLHNRDVIARRDIRIGDTVCVEKAGDIIPEIVGVNLARRPTDAEPFAFPQRCPGCSTPVVQAEGGALVRCPNADCPAQLRRRLVYFASEACLDIDGLGESTIDALVSAGRLARVADLYRLRREDFALPGRTMDISADSLLASIAQTRNAELWRFINGLGIPQVGPATSRKLAAAFGSLEALATATQVDFASDGCAADSGIGASATASILAWLEDPANRATIDALVAAGVRPTPPAPTGRGPLAGQAFVLTGTLPTLEREEAVRRIEAAGGVVRSSVSHQTDYVVAGTNPGAKLTRARELGVPVIDEAELLRLLDGEQPANRAQLRPGFEADRW